MSHKLSFYPDDSLKMSRYSSEQGSGTLLVMVPHIRVGNSVGPPYYHHAFQIGLSGWSLRIMSS